MLLEKDEYVEQRFFFKTFLERLDDGYSSQEILRAMKSEKVRASMRPCMLSLEVLINHAMAEAVIRREESPFCR